ncbi:MAG: aldehyde dehydrogenase family protein [Spirochaetia bacterium]|nr:aldehyde dehydrogenase family protein [Spirochaetia bacterium]
MDMQNIETEEIISKLIQRAKKAQSVLETFTQQQVDRLAAAITYEIVTDEKLIDELSEFSFAECRLGDVLSKKIKLREKCRGVYYDVKYAKTVGIVEEMPEKGLVRIAKPVGVIGSLVPSTQAEMHPIIQAIFAVKARDSIIFSPHPRGKRTTKKTVDLIRQVMKKYGGPEDAFIAIEEPSVPLTQELMKQCDLVMATGGQPMVRAAYSSGTPAYGVGAGNAIIYIDSSADLEDAAKKIIASKVFDLSAGCSCDNSLIIDKAVYQQMLGHLSAVGFQLLDEQDKQKLRKAIWPQWPENHVINRDVVASVLENIGKIAGIAVLEGKKAFMVEETLTGEASPFSGEKMCLALSVYASQSVEDAVRIINENHAYSGAGHSCGVFAKDQEVVDIVALGTYTTRVVVNQSQSATNTGNWNNGMSFTSSLGCGTWGGNIVSENICLKHYMNNTWVIREIPYFKPSDDQLFSGFTPIQG